MVRRRNVAHRMNRCAGIGLSIPSLDRFGSLYCGLIHRPGCRIVIGVQAVITARYAANAPATAHVMRVNLPVMQ